MTIVITPELVTRATLTAAEGEVINALFAGNHVNNERSAVRVVAQVKIYGEI